MFRCMVFLFFCFHFSFKIAQAEQLNDFENREFLVDQTSLNESLFDHSSKFPIILHHGLFGFNKIMFLEYFNGVPKALRNLGYEVYVTKVNPIGSVKERASQLAAQIDHILELSGKEKVNIIAHSMGGLDARYLVSQLGFGDKVASISMISTPNHGSYIAEMIVFAYDLNKKLTKKIFDLIGFPKVSDTNIIKQALIAIRDCSEKYVRLFNQTVTNHSMVYYQSWAGSTSTRKSDQTASMDPLFIIPYWILREKRGHNDGLISVSSAKWGHYKGLISADHLDQIGFWWKKNFSQFRYRMFYQKVASGLARKGF